MAINTIEYAQKLQTKLDEYFVQEATSGWMEANAGQVIYNGGNEIKIPMISTEGAADYDRSEGYAIGGVTHEYQTHKFRFDRARMFRIDTMDVDETNFVLTATNVVKDYTANKLIPEIDAVRYSTIADIAIQATKSREITITEANALAELKKDLTAVRKVVGGMQLIVTLGYDALSALAGDLTGSKIVNFTSAVLKQGNLDTEVKVVNGAWLRTVVDDRLNTEVTILDGKSTGQTQGGWTASGKKINWIITPQRTPIGIMKHSVTKVWLTGEVPGYNGYQIESRAYHDLIIPTRQREGLFVSVDATTAP